ncbi:hypothetical protein C8J56DRAFT_888003 [Mycena floridula]|nr:hypothetical protein C8J56DRAFT_887998 [Mycena floridula]KAJ7589776.1 hypothetical protein C8J56DRAFT_888003 [Mycena floridula]
MSIAIGNDHHDLGTTKRQFSTIIGNNNAMTAYPVEIIVGQIYCQVDSKNKPKRSWSQKKNLSKDKPSRFELQTLERGRQAGDHGTVPRAGFELSGVDKGIQWPDIISCLILNVQRPVAMQGKSLAHFNAVAVQGKTLTHFNEVGRV